MLPLVMHEDCATDDDACFKDQRDFLMMMLMMGAQTPNSGTSINSILPMLMMVMMMQSQPCTPTVPHVPAIPEPEPEEVIYRTWRLNADGTRTLVSEGETPQ